MSALTGPGRVLLADLAAREADGRGPVYVYRDPTALGGGVNRRTYDRLRADGMVELGDYVPGRGRPLLLTGAGREAIA